MRINEISDAQETKAMRPMKRPSGIRAKPQKPQAAGLIAKLGGRPPQTSIRCGCLAIEIARHGNEVIRRAPPQAISGRRRAKSRRKRQIGGMIAAIRCLPSPAGPRAAAHRQDRPSMTTDPSPPQDGRQNNKPRLKSTNLLIDHLNCDRMSSQRGRCAADKKLCEDGQEG